ncbi:MULTISPECIES: hypothetical protein [unclassified Sphingomonas]|uniref:hypothetical protein n=1 Tax=unclassified Sphingomonas TaxID=196159 RepID=UPI00226A85D9|nr:MULTISPECIES: hypothetical protein [unclassified Sphingomonas]
MLIVGTEYRVFSMKDGLTSREGVVLQSEGPMFVLDVEGVQTVFHMANVAYAEVVDREAEDARQKVAHERTMAAWS